MLQIKAAVVAIHNVHHLPFVEDFQKHVASVDLFDWLQFCFGFQVIPATFLPPLDLSFLLFPKDYIVIVNILLYFSDIEDLFFFPFFWVRYSNP